MTELLARLLHVDICVSGNDPSDKKSANLCKIGQLAVKEIMLMLNYHITDEYEFHEG